MSSVPLIKSIKINNLLSFGQNDEPLELEPLNVLIGPNGSGKSNLVEIFRLLKSTPKSISDLIRYGGGIKEWIFKRRGKDDISSVEAKLLFPNPGIPEYPPVPLLYRIAIDNTADRVEVVDEEILNVREEKIPGLHEQLSFYRFDNGNPIIYDFSQGERILRKEELPSVDASILTRKIDRAYYPELTWIGETFRDFRVFSDWHGGRSSPMRQPQDTAAPEDFLVEDASNLSLILNNMLVHRDTRRVLFEKLARLFEGAGELTSKVYAGRIQLFLEEYDLHDGTPVVRLSDGTLRYLALLAILCHPSPPPLICIEEPELGIHPDVILDIAELLKEASTRTQLIVTTHSPTLISALDDQPTAVVVAEKDKRGTKLKRLESERMKVWLEKYSLGELWESGEIGGNRW